MAEKLIVRIGSNTAGFESGLRKAGNVATKWAKRMTIAFTGVLTVSALIGSKFEQSLKLAGAIAGATGKDFAALEKEARRLGKTTAFTATQAAEGMTNLARTGLKTEEIIRTTGVALEFAGAHATDLGQSTQILAAAMNVFELDASEARRVADTFTFALDNSLLTIDKLREGMKNAAVMGAVLDKSVEETTTALAAFVNMGLEGSRAGMQYRMAMQNMLKQTPRVTKALGELGLTFSDVNPKTLSFGEMLDFISKKIPQTADSTKTFIALFGRAGTFMELLAKKTRNATFDFEAFVKGMKKSQEEAGITARRYADMMDTFRGQWKILWSAIQELGISIFMVYKDQGKAIFQFLADRIVSLADFISENGNKIMIGILEFFRNLIGASLKVSRQLFDTFSGTFRLIIKAQGEVAAAFVFMWMEIKRVFFSGEFSQSFKDHIIEPLKISATWIKDKLTTALDFYIKKLKETTLLNKKNAKSLKEQSKAGTEAANKMRKAFEKYADAVVGPNGVFEKVTKKGKKLQGTLSDQIVMLKEKEVERIFQLDVLRLQEAARTSAKIREVSKDTTKDVVDDVEEQKDTFLNFFSGLKFGFKELTEKQQTWASKGRRSAKEFAQDASSSFADFINPLKDDFLSLESLWDAMLESMVGSLTKAVADMAVQWALQEVVKPAVGFAAGAAGAAGSWLINAASDYFNYKSGAWEIKKDQIAGLHKGELVLPKSLADQFRGDGSGYRADPITGTGQVYGLAPSLQAGVVGAIPGALLQSAMITAKGGIFGFGKEAILQNMGWTSKTARKAYTGAAVLSRFMPPGISDIFQVAAAAAGERLADWRNTRQFEEILDFWEDMGVSRAKAKARAAAASAGAEGFAPGFTDISPGQGWRGELGGEGGFGGGGGISGGEFGGGMGGMTARGGWAHGPESGYKQTLHGSEYILNEDQFKAVRELNAGGGKGQTIRIGSLVKIEGNLIADQATFDDFLVKINDGLFKLAEMGF